MSLFKTAVNDCISMVEYEYANGEYTIRYDELVKLCEHIAVTVIYCAEVRDEIYRGES